MLERIKGWLTPLVDMGRRTRQGDQASSNRATLNIATVNVHGGVVHFGSGACEQSAGEPGRSPSAVLEEALPPVRVFDPDRTDPAA